MEIKISEYRVSELWVSEGVTGLKHNLKMETGAFLPKLGCISQFYLID